MAAENNGGTVEKLSDASDDAKGKRQRSSIAFPYMDLDEAVNLATAIHSNVGTGNCSVAQLAPWVGQSPSSSAFRNRLTAAKLFGLVDADNADALHITETGKLVVDPQRAREGRAKAFLNVPLFAALHNKFKGSVIPPTGALERELVALGVADTLKETARRVMERSAEQGGYFESGRDRLVMPGFVVPSGGQPQHMDENKGAGGGSGGGGGGGGQDVDPIIQGLLVRLPKSGDVWPESERKLWLQLLEGSFRLIYKEGGGAGA